MSERITIGSDGRAFVGKRVLVGIRWTSKGDTAPGEQFHGLILEADQDGIVVERSDTGAKVILPPQLEPANPGRSVNDREAEGEAG